MTPTEQPLDLAGAAIAWVLRRIVLMLEKLLVIAKYQFYKRTAVAPSTVRVPWLKLGVVGFFAFFAFKRDLSITLGNGPSSSHFGGRPVAEEVAFKTAGENDGPFTKLASLFEEKDPFAASSGDDEQTRQVKAFVRRFKDVAITEKEKFGIPASIKMAQAIVESNTGKSDLSRKNNNFFGIKCFSRTCKKGHCSNFGDDSHKDFFRKYKNPWESWRAHSQLIVGGKYKQLLKHGDDYEKWARGLKKLGYATAKHYDQTIIEMIEKYNLDALDK